MFCALGSVAWGQPLVANGPEGIDSVYTGYLTQVLKRWVPFRVDAGAEPHDAAPVAITCIATVNADRYVGMIQRERIHAGMPVVENVLDDIDHYKDLFPGTVDVRVLAASRRLLAGTPTASLFDTAWIQQPPIPFLPEIRYEMSHLVEKTPMRTVYRYKLRRGDKLIASDGLVVLEAVDAQTTQFTEYDFFDGHWGLLPTSLVWKESLAAAFHSDVAIKLKAEQPAWSYARIAAEAKRMTVAESEGLERCFRERRALLP
jgi:hypothetical protein